MKNHAKASTTYAFIDSQNLNLGVKSLGWDLDFEKFRIYLSAKYNVVKAFVFIGYMDGNSPLYQYLQESGYIVVFKPILQIKLGKTLKIKGNVDAELVLHSMIEYPNYDRAIIVSGDGDFHCLIEYLEIKQKLFKVIIPNRKKYSQLLQKFNPYIAFMDNLRTKVNKIKKDK